MNRRESVIAKFILAAAVLIALLWPLKTAFGTDGYLFYMVRDENTVREWKELALWALLSGAAVFLLKKPLWKGAALLFISAVFCYIHCTFLPWLVAGLYVLGLLLCGNLVLGAGLIITAECLLSLFGIGNAPHLRIAAAVLLLAVVLFRILKKDLRLPEKLLSHEFTNAENAVLLLTFLVFLVQAGRMNGTLDFDTLWYGVRSDRILAPGSGIYEDLGLLGIVYTYSKGFEVLGLPLSGFRSYSYVLFLNTWLFTVGLYFVYRLSEKFAGSRAGGMAVVFTALTPGIVNMCVSAKPDMITWVLQILMLERFFAWVKKERGANLRQVLSAYLLSLCMKPTSVVFSTALFGMIFLYAVFSYKYSEGFRTHIGKTSKKDFMALVLSFLSLLGIWGRTVLLTGLPFTSVFSGILTKIGFTVKYPFRVSKIPENYQDRSAILVLLDRIYHMLLSPVEKDMSHVVIAWGGSFFFVAVVVILLTAVSLLIHGKGQDRRGKHALWKPALMVFVPFIAVNLISLSMLYQVDGNYFMTLYSVLILFVCCCFSEPLWTKGRKAVWMILGPVLLFQFVIMSCTNWASGTGFTTFRLNRGSYNHVAYDREYFDAKGASEIWEILENEPEARVIAIAEHPFCLSLPAVVQSFEDTFDTWGNPDVVYSADTYEEYLRFAKVDYIYLDPSYFDVEWHRRARLIYEGLLEKGILEEIAGQNCLLYRVLP